MQIRNHKNETAELWWSPTKMKLLNFGHPQLHLNIIATGYMVISATIKS